MLYYGQKKFLQAYIPHQPKSPRSLGVRGALCIHALKVLTNLIIFGLLTRPVNIKGMAHSDLWLHYRKKTNFPSNNTFVYSGDPPLQSSRHLSSHGVVTTKLGTSEEASESVRWAGSARSFLNVLLPASDEQCFHFLKVKASRGALTIPLAW